MHRTALHWLLPAVFAVAASAAQAQNAPRAAAPPDPLDAKAGVAPLVYRSALHTYRRLGDDKPVPWREANDTVGRIGGWRAYAREASEPAAPESAAPAAPVTPMPAAAASAPARPLPAGHGGHKMH